MFLSSYELVDQLRAEPKRLKFNVCMHTTHEGKEWQTPIEVPKNYQAFYY